MDRIYFGSVVNRYLMLLRTVFFSCFLVMTCPVMGQVAQKQLTKADYHLWSRMQVEQLSDLGNWVSYSLDYQAQQDTLFVKHTQRKQTYAFADGTQGVFGGEQWFICKGSDNRLLVTNLLSGQRTEYQAVSSYQLSVDGRYLILLCQEADQSKRMEIRDLAGNNSKVLDDVGRYSYHAKAAAVAYTISGADQRALGIVKLDKSLKNKTIDNNTAYDYLELAWQESGQGLVCYKGNRFLSFYRLAEEQYFEFDTQETEGFPKGHDLFSSGLVKLTVSKDGERVFFGLQQQMIATDTSGVQVWHTADRWIHPQYREIEGWQSVPKVGVWWPETDSFLSLTDTVLPKVMLTGDQHYALTYNPMAYEPQFNHSGPVDFYLTDLATNKRTLLLERQSSDDSKTFASTGGKYVAYFKDGHWWVYDIQRAIHRNLTQSISVSFDIEHFDMADEPSVYGLAGWTDDDAYLLLYDRYDLWKIAADGTGVERLTTGREQQVCYRLVPLLQEQKISSNFNRHYKGVYSLTQGLLLSAQGEQMNGYFEWTPNKGMQVLVLKNKRVSQFLKSTHGATCVYVEEHFHEPPKLMVITKTKAKPRLLFQNNPQHQNYEWGFSKLISYYNSNGQLLKGALFYPAGYTPDKSYPMVVKIYERLSDDFDQYVLPTDYNGTGFNTSNLTSQGYFVLLPDIVYEIGKTGLSATDCVVSAVKEVLANETVDPKRVGLIGHSFGGYETYFIITQTHLFATAVAGAGMTDIISNYLYVGWNIGRPNGWRYEYHQSRLGKSLFEDRSLYESNSPLAYVEQVQTPLLTWSGEEDKQVHYYQSLEFYLAMRRLKKRQTLLLYEGERHVIMGKEHQRDLTHRIEAWFDYYLKGGVAQSWMQPQN